MTTSSVRRKYGIIIFHTYLYARMIAYKCISVIKRIDETRGEIGERERKIKSTQKPSLRSAAFFLVLFFLMLNFHRPR